MSEIKDETHNNLNLSTGHPKVSEVSLPKHVREELRSSLEKGMHINEDMEKIIWKLITHFEENY